MAKIKNTINNNIDSAAMILSKELFFVLFVLAIVFIFQPTRADAATFNVATGSSEANIGDSVCQLNEAVYNINEGSRIYTDCVETGVYGTDDTIFLPVGTISGSGSGSGFENYKPVKIIGKGQGKSIINDRGLALYSGSGIGPIDATLQDFTLKGRGIEADSLDHLTIRGVEINGLDGSGAGILAYNSNYVEIQDSYVHNYDTTTSGPGAGAVTIHGDGNSIVNIDRMTISHIKGTALSMFYQGSAADEEITATIKNTTITDITTSATGSGLYLNDLPIGISAIGNVNYTTINNTYSNFAKYEIDGFNSAALVEVSLGDSNIHHIAQNDLYAVGNGSGTVNYQRANAADFGGPPSVAPTFTTTSLGGNLSSDNSLSTWLNKPTDKHKQTSLASFLGALSDNGGKVPTLALLKNSPAVDSGVTVSGLTSDARGAIRPQGNAFDAGAYESAFTAESLAGTGQASRPAVFIASLLTLAGGALALVRKLKNRAKFIALR